MSIPIDKLSSSLSECIASYSKEVQKETLKSLDETADKVLDYVSLNCPRSNGGSEHLADSFVKTEIGEGLNKVIYISSKTKGRLVHLIELGFKHKSGKHVAAQPFLRPAYDAFAPKMLEEIKSIIENGG